MPRLLFEKTGNSVWISHLDLMRLFQRAFKRANLPLKHTQGFNPRPSVSIALPLSVGVQSMCELLDFELEGQNIQNEDICHMLNEKLIDGVSVLKVYDDGRKIRDLAYLACTIDLAYDRGVPDHALEQVEALFVSESIIVEKKGKNGYVEHDIRPMIRQLTVSAADEHRIRLEALICCQNPSLNPSLLVSAVERYLPQCTPDDVAIKRIEIYDNNQEVFR